MLQRVDVPFASGSVRLRSSSSWTRVDVLRGLSVHQLFDRDGGLHPDYLCDEVVPFVDERWPTVPGLAITVG